MNTIDIELLKVDEIFGDIGIDQDDIIDTSVPTYPEIILQSSEKGTKYYTAYQSHSRQFINNESNDRIVRWKNSSIENINSTIVEQLFLGSSGRSAKISKEKKNYVRPTSSALFSWSSTDEYIERRKRELRLKGKKINGDDKEMVKKEEDPDTTEDLNSIHKLGINPPNNKIMVQLSQVVDNESSQFIHERIQIIKQHHSQKINEMISERKRKDHEIHLQRLKQKEEEYERELKMALDDKKDKGLGFLGGIFNFNSDNHHSPSNSISGSIDDNSSINATVDLKKRFSFLPNNLFSSSTNASRNSPKPMPSTPPRNKHEVVVEFEAPPTPTKSPIGTSQPKESPVNIKGNDLDLMFQMPNDPESVNNEEDDDFDDFAEFTSSPPPQPTEKTIKVHTLMKMNEPTPLINLEDHNEDHDDRKEPTKEKVNDLLIL